MISQTPGVGRSPGPLPLPVPTRLQREPLELRAAVKQARDRPESIDDKNPQVGNIQPRPAVAPPGLATTLAAKSARTGVCINGNLIHVQNHGEKFLPYEEWGVHRDQEKFRKKTCDDGSPTYNCHTFSAGHFFPAEITRDLWLPARSGLEPLLEHEFKEVSRDQAETISRHLSKEAPPQVLVAFWERTPFYDSLNHSGVLVPGASKLTVCSKLGAGPIVQTGLKKMRKRYGKSVTFHVLKDYVLPEE